MSIKIRNALINVEMTKITCFRPTVANAIFSGRRTVQLIFSKTNDVIKPNENMSVLPPNLCYFTNENGYKPSIFHYTDFSGIDLSALLHIELPI